MYLTVTDTDQDVQIKVILTGAEAREVGDTIFTTGSQVDSVTSTL